MNDFIESFKMAAPLISLGITVITLGIARNNAGIIDKVDKKVMEMELRILDKINGTYVRRREWDLSHKQVEEDIREIRRRRL